MANHLVKQHLKRMQDLLHAATEVNDAALAAWDAEDDAQLDLALERSLQQARFRDMAAQRRAENTDGAA